MTKCNNFINRYTNLTSLSLFTCGGIGDLGFRASGLNFLAMNELESDRASLARLNFPEAIHFEGDIQHIADDLINAVQAKLHFLKQDLFLVSCTAPCQGMSSAGMGSILNNVRSGKRRTIDPRNRLILPALKIIQQLKPLWIVFENVLGMRNTLIEDNDGAIRPILHIIHQSLSPEYIGSAYPVEFADYGVPQRRQRLITIYSRISILKKRIDIGTSLIPLPSHSRIKKFKCKPWISVSEALRDFPKLDSISLSKSKSKFIPFHRVPVLDKKKYEWVRNTPPSKSAFDNQCINPKCNYQGNAVHGTRQGIDGINRALYTTPLYCLKCGSLLPRPYAIIQNGHLRIMRGYTSAYKRMPADLPAPTLSRNMSFPCSDQKIHPTENRVLSLAEALRLQTIDSYEYKWGPLRYKNAKGNVINKEIAPDTLIRIIIAESIPPLFTELLSRHILKLTTGDRETNEEQRQKFLLLQ